MITLSDGQNNALAAINDFIASPDQIFTLFGLAGTGKTSLICSLVQEHTNASLVAPTGKAASVLAMKASYEARTIHSLFYRLVEKGVDENGKRVLVFQKTFRPNSLEGSLIFLDECSMVGTKIGSELKSSGAKIIACGDHGQLQPIGEKQFFTKANFTLTEIHRQALESSIIRQAHYARETGNYKADGDDFRVTNQITPDNLREADIVLCWTNKTRHVFNEIIREIKGFTAKHPQAGESVMCLKNARDYGIYNGAIYTLARDMLLSDKHIYLNIDGNEFKIPNCYFAKAGETIDDYDNKKITSLFCYGYACTVNKGQGSEWDNVILVDEYSRSDQRKEWIYTAISRASKKILIQR